MRWLLGLLLVACISVSQAQDSTQAKRGLKFGANWAPMVMHNGRAGGGLSQFGLTFNFNDRHTLTVGPSFLVDFDFRFERMDEPFVRVGYQFQLGHKERKLKYYLTYDCDYRRTKGDYHLGKIVDGNFQYEPVQKTTTHFVQPVGVGMKWYFFKRGYLQFEAGASFLTTTDYFDFEEPSIIDYRSTSTQGFASMAIGIGYDFVK